ncbi:hypothetical protein HPP92_011258 [Vanilla planifolia]|uniref:RIN4 pathogenic type III effector avirulence factor Avr cleavage site domain-containing protein n=1 Tax=Vanilla planifolia TaxID=51239 RepID=A0A835V1M0_VANPL|nr:hypothetical protein HPP92_011258 [Vanilla planifolia]
MGKNQQVTKGDSMSVPAFGAWDMQQGMTDYSLNFSKIRQMRMQSKSDYSIISVGNEAELLPAPPVASSVGTDAVVRPAVRQRGSPSVKKDEWMSVPAFGEWDMQQAVPDYSLDFSKVRQKKMQSKSDYFMISVGNEAELLPRPLVASSDGVDAVVPSTVHHRGSLPWRKKFMSCLFL